MRWVRLFKTYSIARSLLIIAIVIITATMSFGLLTACESDNRSGATDDNSNTEDSNNSSDNNENGNDFNNDDMSNIKYIYAIINDNRLEIELSQNTAVNALLERLNESDIIYTARDYGGFEKVGSIGVSLPMSDTNINAEAGDVMLYQGNQIVMFHGENRYSYTRIGKIKGYSTTQLKSILNAEGGNIQVTLSLDSR